MMRHRHVNLWSPLSSVGVLVGTLIFAATLTPTLGLRTSLPQGVLSGGGFAIGYGIGAFAGWLWTFMELPPPGMRTQRIAARMVAVCCAAIAIGFLWLSNGWQDSVRKLMDVAPVSSAHALVVVALAATTALVLIALARLFALVLRAVAALIGRFVPRRIANVTSAVVAFVLLWLLATDVIMGVAFRVLDASYQQYDALIEPERLQPTAPLKTGSAASLLSWNDLGRAGREFVSSGPGARAIEALSRHPAQEPIRVYVGLRAADTAHERARLALAELKRVDAFNRAALIVITPTGTGWVDPAAIDSVEYLYNGDIASVAVQYSYLSSPLSLLVLPDYGARSARALFDEIYGYWTSLPKDRRPKLYLHGLSLGAMNSEQSAHLLDTVGDPFQGALWSGPPFTSKLWRSFTDARNPGSPSWLPQIRDGALVRFMNQNGVGQDGRWGPMRIVYLQYASDAITFFDYSSLYRKPDWMMAPRGPDVSPALRWRPVVTFLQLALDLATATTTPPGYGHVYAAPHYLDAWLAVTGIQGWSAEDLARLKRHLAAAQARGESDPSSAYVDRGG
ncbi:alpha/beta-hydrolase family protein [Paraburkholderia sp. IMGN_8]|uniref:alpha/beta hydrolase n=1 Tax=Paraburkholderia sp. IMGN_8 TaxID=3136564 RepID=UPI00310175E4